ncbi:TrkA family potassium uptake protein, partial [bacterium]|nr:TrkA family potassium uptake protein [bacterium]
MRSYSVIGLGEFGMAVARMLADVQRDGISAYDSDITRVEMIKEFVAVAAALDATDKAALVAQGVDRDDVAIIAIGNDFTSNTLAAMNCKEIGVKLVISRALSEEHGRVLRKLGVDRVIYPERDIAANLVQAVLVPNITRFARVAPGIGLAHVQLPKGYKDVPLGELGTAGKVRVVAVLKHPPPDAKPGTPPTVDASPQAVTPVGQGDIIIVFGPNEEINQL